jgi:hypothetical protein
MQSRSSIGGGGPASLPDTELQADVMRFVAILALCLVAISTLVEQSRQPAEPTAVAPIAVAKQSVAPLNDPAEPAVTPSSEQIREPADSHVTPAPAPEAAATRPAVVQQRIEPVERVQPEPSEQGLLLRFASDAALLRMVSRGDAAVFVVTAAGASRLDLRRGVDFVVSSAPESFYKMAPQTIPALLRASYPGPDDAFWGVTLPGNTVTALGEHVAQGGGGVLVIDASGGVTREAVDD